MAKCKEVRLTHNEICLLIALVQGNKEGGAYWGRKDYFLKRQDVVLKKLYQAASTKLT